MYHLSALPEYIHYCHVSMHISFSEIVSRINAPLNEEHGLFVAAIPGGKAL